MSGDESQDGGGAGDGNPNLVAEREYAVWLNESDESVARQQSVQGELIAEHHLMGAVLQAMDKQRRHIDRGVPMNTSFWAGVVDFNGNFVHYCHRVKEEEHLIPALVANGGLPGGYLKSVQAEHQRAKDLTLSIRDGVEEGDWEKVTRLVAMYVSFLGPHMQHEESELFGSLSANLPPDEQIRLRAEFTRVEANALGTGGRPRFVTVAKQLMRSVRVDYPI